MGQLDFCDILATFVTHERASFVRDFPPPRIGKLTIKRGAVSVQIYVDTPLKHREDYRRYTLVWREADGVRKRRGYTDFEEAKRAGENLATRLANGQTDILKLSNADVAELQRAREILAPHELSVSIAAHTLAAALQRLPAGTELLEAVEFFAKRHPANSPKKTVCEVVDEFIADRDANGCSDHHLRDLGIRLNRFATAFAMPIAAVEPSTVREYIRTLTNGKTGKPARARSKENTLRMLKTLFGYARKQRYIPRDLEDEITDIEPPRPEPAHIGIYTPQEIARLLVAAGPALVPPLAIAAFAGLRLAEVSRLDWSEVHLQDRFIVVEAAKSKTAARRIVPMSDNLAAWLTPHWKATGTLNPAETDNALGDRFERVAARLKIKWQRNGFRHSCISYRVALVKNVAQVALECGNSPAVIFSNYRELVREEDSKAWFSVRPPTSAENIVTLPTAATA